MLSDTPGFGANVARVSGYEAGRIERLGSAPYHVDLRIGEVVTMSSGDTSGPRRNLQQPPN